MGNMIKITDYTEVIPSSTDVLLINQNGSNKKTTVESLLSDVNSSLSDMASDQIYYCGATSGTNTYTASNSKIIAYKDGLTVRVKIGNASTGASTLNINGLGAKTILDTLGNPITSGGLKAGLPYQLCYNGTNFIVLGKGGGGDALASQLLLNKKASVDSGQIVGTMPDNSAVSSTLTDNNQEYIIPLGYHNGLGKIKAIITNLVAAVIKAGTTVGGIVGTFTADATAMAADIISGKTAYVNGIMITGIATIASLGGMKVASGTITSANGAFTIPAQPFTTKFWIAYYLTTADGSTYTSVGVGLADANRTFYATGSGSNNSVCGPYSTSGQLKYISGNNTIYWVAFGV